VTRRVVVQIISLINVPHETKRARLESLGRALIFALPLFLFSFLISRRAHFSRAHFHLFLFCSVLYYSRALLIDYIILFLFYIIAYGRCEMREIRERLYRERLKFRMSQPRLCEGRPLFSFRFRFSRLPRLISVRGTFRQWRSVPA